VFDTSISIVGNVLTAPEWRKTSTSGHLVANFRVASTSRRLDRETGRWVDGNSLRVRVVCWRKLAEGIAASLTVGDPVVVTGRLFTRDWIDGENNARTSYEMEAVAVGHDLARGRGRFYRTRATPTSAVEGDGQVRGESADLVPEAEVPVGYGEGIPDEEEPTFEEAAPSPDPAPGAEPDSSAEPAPGAEPDSDSPARLAGGGFEPFEKVDGSVADELELAVEAVAEVPSPRARRSSRRQPVAA
jgi:single-strand DNA-binding protein